MVLTTFLYNQLDMARLLLNYSTNPKKSVAIARVTRNAEVLKMPEEAGATLDNLPRHKIPLADYISTENGGKFGLC